MVLNRKTKNAMKFESKIVRVVSLNSRFRQPARMLILGKIQKWHEIVELDFMRFIDTFHFDSFEPLAKNFTVHTVVVDFWTNEPARQLLSGCAGILTEYLDSMEDISSAQLRWIFSKFGLDSEA